MRVSRLIAASSTGEQTLPPVNELERFVQNSVQSLLKLIDRSLLNKMNESLCLFFSAFLYFVGVAKHVVAF